jgi:hypothetical protein
MDIKIVLESFGKPLQGMSVGFGSSAAEKRLQKTAFCQRHGHSQPNAT